MKKSEWKQIDLFDDKHDKDISTIDRLFEDIRLYRKSEEFIRKLNFYIRFPHLGIYNAALVEQQRPGARLVLSAEKWEKKYQRKVKTNARPVIILLPFYPVDFLFDISDTRPIEKKTKEEDKDIIEDIVNSFRATCIQDTSAYMDNIRENLPKFGIMYDNKLIVGTGRQAEIRADQTETLSIKFYKDHYAEYKNYFTIGINVRASEPEQLASTFHELGHLFCRHLDHPWCKHRAITKQTEEFEAEIVSYLVCSRLGIMSYSKEYLASYIGRDNKIPPISIDYIFQAVDLIEKMIAGHMKITDCLLYKKDKEFKKLVNEEKARIKKEEAEAKAARTK